MTARFWIMAGADNEIRVKLNPGQTVAWERRSATDEGWSAEGMSYTHEGEWIVRQWWSDGRDCDGRMSDSGRDRCRLDRLTAYSYQWEGKWHNAPLWEPEEREHRDYQAEAAGY